MIELSIPMIIAAGIMLAVVVYGAVLLFWPQPVGFNRERVLVRGVELVLTEISAMHRERFMRFCSSYSITDGFQLMRGNLEMSVMLIALHRRRPLVPQWLIRWRLKSLSDEALAELFRHCVRISNIPFDIKPPEAEDAEPDLSAETESAPDDDWDDLDEPEKKNSPPVRQ